MSTSVTSTGCIINNSSGIHSGFSNIMSLMVNVLIETSSFAISFMPLSTCQRKIYSNKHKNSSTYYNQLFHILTSVTSTGFIIRNSSGTHSGFSNIMSLMVNVPIETSSYATSFIPFSHAHERAVFPYSVM